MLTIRQKSNIIKDFKINEKDTGSAAVQVALITKQINELTDHLKKHRKDNHSRRGLLTMVGKRKRLMDYLSKTNPKSYNSVAKKLELK
ncbi:MAG: small subunit ribosomal protein S15 [Parcubacteria group bacterium Athens0714_26]|nr:MAG: small subunit ribosomal protein S15 [Parcubacteria group bacterium Athens1014_26]TSD03696.1 MAG: small subunit ribosomal protein S15 [Parcubacteria group bacterium Athens0714_26]